MRNEFAINDENERVLEIAKLFTYVTMLSFHLDDRFISSSHDRNTRRGREICRSEKINFLQFNADSELHFFNFPFFLCRLLLSGSLLITKSSVNDREINPLNYSLLINYQFRYPSGDVQRGFCNVFGTFQKSFYWKYLHKRQIQRSDLSSGIFF